MQLKDLTSLIETKQEFTVLKGVDWEEDEKSIVDFPSITQSNLDKISLVVDEFIKYNNNTKLELRYYKNYSPFWYWNNTGLFNIEIINTISPQQPRLILSIFERNLHQNKNIIKKHLIKYVKRARLDYYNYEPIKTSLYFMFWLEENKQLLEVRKFIYSIGFGTRKPSLNFITDNIRVKVC